MNNLEIFTRLALLIDVLSMLLSSIGSIGRYGMTKSDGALRSFYKDRAVRLVQSGQIQYLMIRNRLLVAHVLIV